MEALSSATLAYTQAPLKSPKPTADRMAAMKQAQEFEAVFIADALKHMYQGVAVDPLNGDGAGSESWRELLVDEYAKDFEARGGLGLAEPIAAQLLAIQEAHS